MSWPTVLSMVVLFTITLALELGFVLLIFRLDEERGPSTRRLRGHTRKQARQIAHRVELETILPDITPGAIAAAQIVAGEVNEEP